MRRDHRHHDGMRMPAWMRRWTYATGAACLLTGLLWLAFDGWIVQEGPFGQEAHWLQRYWLLLHGAAGMLMLWVFGLVWLAHVRRGWAHGHQRRSGGTMVSGVIILALSGWALYYVGGEVARVWISRTHWIAGLLTAVWLPIHITRSRRALRRLRPPG